MYAFVDTLVPRKCEANERGKSKHRICQTCWWDKDFGFCRENIPHFCPGCVNDLPYPESIIIDIIDLTNN
jgi:hypothetical protein